jgi:glucose-1-phosphate cytidylyltransferase
LNLDENKNVVSFQEKPKGDGSWINGGFFVLEPRVFDLLHSDETVWEREPLETLAKERQLLAYPHTNFWQPMDTLRDKNLLEELWKSERAPWKLWK